MHPSLIKEKALQLRHAGYSYGYISKATGVSKSTLSDWLSKVIYSPNSEMTKILGNARAAAGAKKAKIKQETFLQAQQEAVRDVGALTQRDVFMFGLGLYLGEGNKTNDIVRIVNSDSRVICLGMAWFKTMGISRRNFAITLYLYPDSNIEECIKFWSLKTGIPRSQFLKVQIDWRKNKKTYKLGKLPYGTAQLAVRSLGEKRFGVLLSRKILAAIDVVANRTAGLV